VVAWGAVNHHRHQHSFFIVGAVLALLALLFLPSMPSYAPHALDATAPRRDNQPWGARWCDRLLWPGLAGGADGAQARRRISMHDI
jgi:hypothetical protein